MCQIIVKQAGQKFNFKKLDVAQGWNSDGYGVTWWENKQLNTFKTMDYNKFKAILSTLKRHKAVAHLRNTTRGTTCTDNNHPFDIPSGKLFHNGTISGIAACTAGGSDTQGLSELIGECDYRYVEDITPMINHIVGDVLNKLVFFEDDGRITYVNKHLGQEEEGIWYSNDYHTKKLTRQETRDQTYSSGTTYVLNEDTGKYERVIPKATIPTTKVTVPKVETGKGKDNMFKVFVYGTLKKGFNNHKFFLKDAEFVGNATSVGKWAMIGEGMPFPYLLGRQTEDGKNIVGEVYNVTVDQLDKLDMLEGVSGGHYKHSTIYVSYKDGKPSENVKVYVKCIPSVSDYAKNFIADFQKNMPVTTN